MNVNSAIQDLYNNKFTSFPFLHLSCSFQMIIMRVQKRRMLQFPSKSLEIGAADGNTNFCLQTLITVLWNVFVASRNLILSLELQLIFHHC